MTRGRFTAAWIVLAALALTACAGPRTTGPSISPGYRPVQKGVEANLWYYMEKAERELKNSPFVIRDPELNQYVRGVVCRVVGNYCEDLRIYLIRTPHFNASMAPNGMMQIWSGLLLRVQNEAQFAAVIGHELGHYVRQHSLHRFEDIKGKADFAAFLGLGLAVAGGGPAGSIANLIILASIFSYSREQEREADAFGLKVLAKTGYDPIEASRVWKRLIRERDAAEEKEERDFFFSSHPAPDERAETLAKMAEKETLKDVKYDAFRERLVAALKKHKPWMLTDQIRLRQPWPRRSRTVRSRSASGYVTLSASRGSNRRSTSHSMIRVRCMISRNTIAPGSAVRRSGRASMRRDLLNEERKRGSVSPMVPGGGWLWILLAH